MSSSTKIEWTDRTWNPVSGCTKVSAGCDNCYAENIAHRFSGTKAFPNGFGVTVHEERLDQPYRWKNTGRVFVNSTSDLFHDAVPDLVITRIFDVMEANPQQTFQVLTKRHARMRAFVQAREENKRAYAAKFDHSPTEDMRNSPAARDARARAARPPANIWLGVSVENQRWADIRIPALLETPAAVRFVSCEPLLGPVELHDYLAERRDVTYPYADAPDGAMVDGMVRNGDTWHRRERLHWVIVGGESGAKARPMHPEWARSIRDECDAAEVAFFFKQWGEYLTAVVEDDPSFAGGRAYTGPLGGRSSATLRVPGPSGTFRGGTSRLMRPGERTSGTVMLDADTIAVRVGKAAAGRVLDGRTHDAFPEPARCR